MKTHLKYILAFTLALSFMPGNLSAKETRKYLTLTLGLTDEQKVPQMPSDIGEDLNYNRNIVRISIARELKVIRFEPSAIGQTNFVLRDGKGRKIVEYVITVRKSNL